ncbi:MAG TPA: hypothetical protein VIH61_06440, partial [Waddliaceae bacterium]
MKNKTLISVILLIVIFIPFFWSYILPWGLEYSLKYMAYRSFGGQFAAHSVVFENGMWRLKNPRLTSLDNLQESKLHAEAEIMYLKIIPHILDWELAIEMSLEKPQIHLDNQIVKSHAKQWGAWAAPGLIAVSSKISFHEGKILIDDPKRSEKQSLFFDLFLELHSGDILDSNLHISVDDPELKNHTAAIHISQNDAKEHLINIQASQISCTPLKNTLQAFFPNLEKLDIATGEINGEVNFVFPEEDSPRALGKLSISDASFDYAQGVMKGHFKNIDLHLIEVQSNKEQRNTSKNSLKSRWVGHLEIAKGSTLELRRGTNNLCKLTDLAGIIYFQSKNSARINIEGKCLHHDTTSMLRMEGEAHFAKERDGSLELNCRLGSGSADDALVRFMTRQLGARFKLVEVAFENIGPDEADLIQALAFPHYPQVDNVRMLQGRINASAIAYIKGMKISDVKVEKFRADHLELNIPSWSSHLHAANLSGEFAVNLSAEKILESLNADINVANGLLSFRFGEAQYDLTHLDTHLTIRRGVALPSQVQGKFADMHGTIDLDGLALGGKIAKCTFTGRTEKLVQLIEKNSNLNLSRFANDHITLQADIQRSTGQLSFEGNAKLSPALGNSEQLISFGFIIEKEVHTANSSKNELQVSLATLDSSSLLIDNDWISNDWKNASFVLQSGWISSDNLSLDKYLKPFLFPKSNMLIGGEGLFRASFDKRKMRCDYKLSNLTLENEDLHVVASLDQTPISGFYNYDLETFTGEGEFLLEHANYFEKNKGILFTNISSPVTYNLQNKWMKFAKLSSVVCGMEFAGILKLDFSMPEPKRCLVDLHAHWLKGSFTQLQHLLGHFDELQFFRKIPLEGQLHLSDQCLQLNIDTVPGKMVVNTTIKGSLSNGYIPNESDFTHVENIFFNFDYDQAKRSFNISKLSGTITVDSDEQTEQYSLAADTIALHNIDKHEGNFDIWISDSQRDILRLVGSTSSELTSPTIVDIHFDKSLTHFGVVHPTNIELQIQRDFQVESLGLEFNMNLSSILKDLQAIARTRLIPLPAKAFQSFNQAEIAEGNLAIKANYDAKTSMIHYHAIGEEISFDDHQFKKVQLHGNSKDHSWTLEQLTLDDLTIAADITRTAKGLKLDFIGLSYADFLVMGLEGEYLWDCQECILKVNLLE